MTEISEQVIKKNLKACPYCYDLWVRNKLTSLLFKPMQVQNTAALKKHLIQRPWEVLALVEIEKGAKHIRCKECAHTFMGIDTFATHLEESPGCYNAVMEQLFMQEEEKPGKDEFIFYDYRPGEKDVITQSIKTDKRKYKALYPHGGEIDYSKGTSKVFQEVRWGPRNRAATIFGVAGIPGSGKSTLAISLSFTHRQEWFPYVKQYRDCKLRCRGMQQGPDFCGGYCMKCKYFEEDPKSEERQCDGIKVAVAFSVPKGLRALDFLSYGDCLIVDEMPLLVGEGSMTRMRQLKTILNVLRKGGISWYFVNPEPQRYIKTYNLILEVIAVNKARGRKFDETVGVTYNRKINPIGWFRIKVISGTKNPIYIKFLELYEEDKDANIDELKEAKGAQSGTRDMDELDEAVERIYNFMVRRNKKFFGPQDMKKTDIGFFVRRLYTGSTADINDLIMHFMSRVEFEPEAFPLLWKGSQVGEDGFVEESIESGEYEFKLVGKEVGGKSMWEDIWKFLPEAEQKAPTRSDKYIRGHAEAFYMSIVEGAVLDAVGRELGMKYRKKVISGSAIANKLSQGGWIARFQEEIMGTLFEIYHLNILREVDPNFIRKAGVGETDIISDKIDTGVEVKARYRQVEVPATQWSQKFLTDESRRRVNRGGKQFLVIYLITRDGRIEISTYEVLKKEQELIDFGADDDETDIQES